MGRKNCKMGAKRLVVVDDVKEIRLLIRAAFAGTRFDVVGEASNGIEAIGVVLETNPDVVLMDIDMPSMDGIETTRHLMDRFPSLTIFGFTGSPDMDQAAMIDAGAVAVFEKGHLAALMDAMDEWASSADCEPSERPRQ
jgi:CheY-like chemotaxis protein